MNQTLVNNNPRLHGSRGYFAGSWHCFTLEREILALGRWAWSEPRIAIEEELRPALHEQRLLALPAAQFFLVGLFPAARGELVVVQLGVECKDGAVARPPTRAGKSPRR